MDWEVGHTVAGRYRLLSRLGQGGMGSVWRAEHRLGKQASSIAVVGSTSPTVYVALPDQGQVLLLANLPPLS